MLSYFLHTSTDDQKVPILIQLALFFNLFYGLVVIHVFADIYYGYLFYLVLFPVFIYKYGVPKVLGLIFTILLFIGLYYTFIGFNEIGFFLKVLVGAFAAYLLMYYIVLKLGFTAATIFKIYLKFAFFAASFGIIQVLAHNLGFGDRRGAFWLFGLLGKYEGGVTGFRVSTFFGEPSYYAMFMSGAVFIAAHDLIYQTKAFYFKRLASILVIIGVYLSFSGTIVGSFVLIFILLGLNYGILRYLVVASPIAVILLFQIINSSKDLESRYDGTLNLFLDAPTVNFNVYKYHGSSVILYDHFFVAWNNFIAHPLFGTGIGSHTIAYFKYSLIKNTAIFNYHPNTKDASSMFNRLLSETGIFGIGLFAYIIFGFFTRRKNNDNTYWLISSACLVVILINMARQGNYFLQGFPFYVWVYYAAWKESKVNLAVSENNVDKNKLLK